MDSPRAEDLRVAIQQALARQRAGDPAGALGLARQIEAEARTLGEPGLLAEALVALGQLRFFSSHYDESWALGEQALALAGEQSQARADALILLAVTAAETHNLDQAETWMLQAIELSREQGYYRSLVRALHGISAGIYMPRARFEESQAADRQAAELARRWNLLDLLWGPLLTLAWTSWQMGRREQALHWNQALKEAAAPRSPADGWRLLLAGHLALETGEDGPAEAYFQQALEIADLLGDGSFSLMARLGLSRFQRENGAAPAALDWARSSLELAERIGYQHMTGMAHLECGRAFWELGRTAEAELHLRLAVETLQALHLHYDLARAELLLAALLQQGGKGQAGEIFIQAAQRILARGLSFLLDQERQWVYPLAAAYLRREGPARQAAREALAALQSFPPPPLCVWALGIFEVRAGRRRLPPATLRARQAGELLALLLLAPGFSLSEEQIAEALSPEKEPCAMQDFVRHAVSALRRALEPELPDRHFPSRYLQVADQRVTLRLPPGSWVDWRAFQAACAAGRWEQALELYQGEFLPEQRYAEWAVLEREALAESQRQALLEMARGWQKLGEQASALELARRLLRQDPWNEAAALVAMRACAVLGETPAALQIFRRLERTLRQELDLPPGEELQAVYRELLDRRRTRRQA